MPVRARVSRTRPVITASQSSLMENFPAESGAEGSLSGAADVIRAASDADIEILPLSEELRAFMLGRNGGTARKPRTCGSLRDMGSAGASRPGLASLSETGASSAATTTAAEHEKCHRNGSRDAHARQCTYFAVRITAPSQYMNAGIALDGAAFCLTPGFQGPEMVFEVAVE